MWNCSSRRAWWWTPTNCRYGTAPWRSAETQATIRRNRCSSAWLAACGTAESAPNGSRRAGDAAGSGFRGIQSPTVRPGYEHAAALSQRLLRTLSSELRRAYALLSSSHPPGSGPGPLGFAWDVGRGDESFPSDLDLCAVGAISEPERPRRRHH